MLEPSFSCCCEQNGRQQKLMTSQRTCCPLALSSPHGDWCVLFLVQNANNISNCKSSRVKGVENNWKIVLNDKHTGKNVAKELFSSLFLYKMGSVLVRQNSAMFSLHICIEAPPPLWPIDQSDVSKWPHPVNQIGCCLECTHKSATPVRQRSVFQKILSKWIISSSKSWLTSLY